MGSDSDIMNKLERFRFISVRMALLIILLEFIRIASTIEVSGGALSCYTPQLFGATQKNCMNTNLAGISGAPSLPSREQPINIQYAHPYDSDIVHMGAKIIKKDKHLYDKGTTGDLSNNDYVYDPIYRTHGRVTQFEFYDHYGGKSANCIRTLGTKYVYAVQMHTNDFNSPPNCNDPNAWTPDFQGAGGTTSTGFYSAGGNWMRVDDTIVCLKSQTLSNGIFTTKIDIEILNNGFFDPTYLDSYQGNGGRCNPNKFMSDADPDRAVHHSTPYASQFNSTYISNAYGIPLTIPIITSSTYPPPQYGGDGGSPWVLTVTSLSGGNSGMYKDNLNVCRAQVRSDDGSLHFMDEGGTVIPNSGPLLILTNCLISRGVQQTDTDQDSVSKTWGNGGWLAFVSQCFTKSYGFDVGCLHPVNYTKFPEVAQLLSHGSDQTNPANLKNMFTSDGSPQPFDQPLSIMGDHVLNGSLLYFSRTQSLQATFDPRSRAYQQLLNNNPHTHTMQNYPGIVGVRRRYDGNYGSDQISRISDSSSHWNSAFRFWGRNSASDAFTRDAPSSTYNSTLPPTKCNARDNNENTYTGSGKCICDQNWLGPTCNIPRPRDTNGNLLSAHDILMASDANDKYGVCSGRGVILGTAPVFIPSLDANGNLIQTLEPNLPICTCMNGFAGSPDQWYYTDKYAAMFHGQIVFHQTSKRGADISCFDTTYYADPLTTAQFRTDANVVNISSLQKGCNVQSTPYVAMFPYHEYLMLHQCLMYEHPATEPNLNVKIDYESFPDAYVIGSIGYEQGHTLVYPEPSFSETGRNAADYGHTNPLFTGQQGIKCMSYNINHCKACVDNGLTSWFTVPSDRTTPVDRIGAVASVVQYMWSRFAPSTNVNGVPQAMDYGGKFCRPCPACNVTNSGCTDVLPITASSTTYCACDVNFCGTLCHNQICPVDSNNKICGHGTCNGVLDNALCEQPPAAGFYTGTCTCDSGYSGADCSIQVCPAGDNGLICSGPDHGTCNIAAKRCDCVDDYAGSACQRPACPRNPVTKEECSGVIDPDTNDIACVSTANPPYCRCSVTTPGYFTIQDSSYESKGFPREDLFTNPSLYYNGRWGVSCENKFTDECLDMHGRWCGIQLNYQGSVIGNIPPGFGGCYNQTCRLLGESSNALIEPSACRPSCKCTTEYAMPNNTFCIDSACGGFSCDASETMDTGDCVVTCHKPGSETTEVKCTSRGISKGTLDFRAKCRCKIFNGTYFYHAHPQDDTTESCYLPAQNCYTGDLTSPCNLHGQCQYNVTSGDHYCSCDHGYSGFNCSIAPPCYTPTGYPCTGPNQMCVQDGASRNPVCICKFNYLRDYNRSCNIERCAATGGTVGLDSRCTCPDGRPFYIDPGLSELPYTKSYNSSGCRKGCVIDPTNGVPCGAYEQVRLSSGGTVARSRCSDLLNGSAIYRDSPLPSPTCVCNFYGFDRKNQTNYFISDGKGSCKPKCNPDGLCNGIFECNGKPTIGADLTCNCGLNWEGDDCGIPACNGRQDSDGIVLYTCKCKNWCHAGDDCEIDLCAATGGSCDGDRPTDCFCGTTPVLTLNVSDTTRTSQRYCVSNCKNGGVLSNDFTKCICPYPYKGVLCDERTACLPQFNGTNCEQSLCKNGGTPKAAPAFGCNCQDNFYRGLLCENDTCISDPKRVRTSISHCTCAYGYLGTNCEQTICGYGGTFNPSSGNCTCFQGFYLADNKTLCILDEGIEDKCVNGYISTTVTGALDCVCNNGWVGPYCDTSVCQSPMIAHFSINENTVVCGCPYPYYGVDCKQNYCNSRSKGPGINPLTNKTECICPYGYILSTKMDDTGTFQCVNNPYLCHPSGTLNWNPLNTTVPCVCVTGFTGADCSVADPQQLVPATPSDSTAFTKTHQFVIIVSCVGGGLILLALYWLNKKATIAIATANVMSER